MQLKGRVAAMASMLKLLERQLGLWDLKRRLEDLGQRPGRCLERGVAYGPCLLVSRECGSGGGRVARLAAERLGWQLFDREILNEIAKLAEVRLQLLNSVDHQTRAQWGDHWRPEPEAGDLGGDAFLPYLRQVILALGHHGDVVILGRGSQYLLPERCCLRVRVVAPLEVRARRVADSDGLAFEDAVRHVENFDARRADFVRTAFLRDSASPLSYDFVINTADLHLPAACDMVMTALHDKLGVQTLHR